MGFKEISDESLTYHLYVPDEWTTDISTGVTSAYYNGADPVERLYDRRSSSTAT